MGGELVKFLFVAGLALVSAFGQNLDPAFHGDWDLNVERSSFGPQTAPQASRLAISPTGWVYATVNAKGELAAFASATGANGCVLIGMPADYTCEIKPVSTRNVTWSLKRKDVVVRAAQFELVGDGKTLRETTRMMPAQGEPVSVEALWEKSVR